MTGVVYSVKRRFLQIYGFMDVVCNLHCLSRSHFLSVFELYLFSSSNNIELKLVVFIENGYVKRRGNGR